MSGKRFAVLIASSQFPNEPKLDPLRFPENDADGLNEILRSEERGNFDNTVVLKNEPRDKVIREIHRILKEARKDDLVLMYYSGHGKLNEQGHLYLTTTDTEISLLESSAIPMETIKRLTDTSPSNKKVIILDCCFSGAAGDVFTRGGVDDQLQMMSKGRGTYLMTASTGMETAIERTEDRFGVFTKHIIDGIRSGDADRNNDGFITMDELYDHVHERVCAEACQEPMKWGLNVRGELVIAKSGKTPKEDRRKQIRKKLLDLGHQDILPDAILSEALAINASDIYTEDAVYISDYIYLLEQLTDSRLKPGDFILEWYKLSMQSKPEAKITPSVKAGKLQPAQKASSAKPEFVNSIEMKFVYIQPGTFMMGSPSDEPGRSDDENLHKVTLTRGFYMQTTTVTLKHWRAFVRATGYKSEAETGDGAYIWTGSEWTTKKDAYWDNPGFDQTDNHPITCVSWNDAQAFIKWLNQEEKSDKYRLPTEAEWEYACRAGTTTPFAFGKCLSADQANYNGNYPLEGCPKGEYRKKTVPVGSFAPNAWGLYDMHGNVYEWVQDIYSEKAIYTSEQTDPIYIGEGSDRVFRGGSWYFDAQFCRSAFRDIDSPDGRSSYVGFRLSGNA